MGHVLYRAPLTHNIMHHGSQVVQQPAPFDEVERAARSLSIHSGDDVTSVRQAVAQISAYLEQSGQALASKEDHILLLRCLAEALTTCLKLITDAQGQPASPLMVSCKCACCALIWHVH